MSILTGYLSATSGTAKIGGIDILENPIKAKKFIGYLPEQPPLYLEMTVKEYLSFVFDLRKSKLNKAEHIKEICDVVQITDAYNRVIRNLSKGYRQRVGIASALVGNPDVLILDEPTNGLDPKQIIDIRNLIKKLGEDHTIILSTHILSEVQTICDRIIIIGKGKIVTDEYVQNMDNALKGNRRIIAKIAGPKDDIIREIRRINGVLNVILANAQDDVASVIVESQNEIDIRKPLFNLLAQKSWPLMEIQNLSASLEEIFITAVNDADATANDVQKGVKK